MLAQFEQWQGEDIELISFPRQQAEKCDKI
jgi:hypothetical protein